MKKALVALAVLLLVALVPVVALWPRESIYDDVIENIHRDEEGLSRTDALKQIADRRIGEDNGRSLELLLAAVGVQPAELRLTFSALKPYDAWPILSEYRDTALQASGRLLLSAEGESGIPLRGNSALSTPYGQGFLMTVEDNAGLVVDSPGPWIGGIVGRIEIANMEDGRTRLSALDESRALFCVQLLQGELFPVVPGAKDSVWRIKGEVKGLLRGWTFYGEADDPLTFLILSDGLTYVGGTGNVRLPSGVRLSLPDYVIGPGARSRSLRITDDAASPADLRAKLALREMSVDKDGRLLWMRSLPDRGSSRLLRFDLLTSIRENGDAFYRVVDGEEALTSYTGVPWIIRRDGNVWVAEWSLRCDDAWDRYWDATRKCSWYCPVSQNEVLLRRFMKDKSKAFDRQFQREISSSQPRGTVVPEEAEIRLSQGGDGYRFVGKLSYALGQTVKPIVPLVRGIKSKSLSPGQWLVSAGIERPTDVDGQQQYDAAIKQLQSLRSEIDRPDLTVADFFKALEVRPALLYLLASHRRNNVQALAVVVDKYAGDKVLGFGLSPGGGDGGYEPFRSVGSVYSMVLSEEQAYQLSSDLAVWEGSLRVVGNPDGQPSIVPSDGTRYRLSFIYPLIIGHDSAGKLNVTAVGRYRDSYPRQIERLTLECAYSSGPFASSRVTWDCSTLTHPQSSPSGESDLDSPNGRSAQPESQPKGDQEEPFLVFTRFGEGISFEGYVVEPPEGEKTK